VAFHHGYTQTDLKVRAYNQVDRWSLRHAAHVVTTSEPFAATLALRGVSAERITVLHNGVRVMSATPAAVASVARSLALQPGERVVLSVGRLSREKGQEYLLRAAAAGARNVRLVVVGDGPDRPYLEKLAASLGLASRVTFAGLINDVAPYYGLADVFALPSLSEGSPNALLEAMAWGLPVVATHVGGVPEIALDGKTALLGPPRDPAFLSRAVERLLGDRELAGRLGSAAKATVLDRHTPEQRVAALSGLYAAIAGGAGAV
jgi:glycosyltransferase involved in cell wall biosynthesis